MKRMRFLAIFLMSATLLAACAGSGNPEGPPTGGTNQNQQQTITLEDDGKTISLAVGDTFLLKLGEAFDWDVSIDSPEVISRKIGVLVVRGAQGIFEAKKTGSAMLTATGDPVCRKSTPPCAAPSRAFRLKIKVGA